MPIISRVACTYIYNVRGRPHFWPVLFEWCFAFVLLIVFAVEECPVKLTVHPLFCLVYLSLVVYRGQVPSFTDVVDTIRCELGKVRVTY